MQNGVVPSNPTKFTLNYIDWLNSVNAAGVKGFGCNYNAWTTTKPNAEIIIWTAIFQARPKLYANYTLTNIGNVGGWVRRNFAIRWFGHYTNVRTDEWVYTNYEDLDQTVTIDGGLWGLNEHMVDFSPMLINSNRANFTISGVILAGTAKWSDGDDDHNIMCSLMQTNCNMWLSR